MGLKRWSMDRLSFAVVAAGFALLAVPVVAFGEVGTWAFNDAVSNLEWDEAGRRPDESASREPLGDGTGDPGVGEFATAQISPAQSGGGTGGGDTGDGGGGSGGGGGGDTDGGAGDGGGSGGDGGTSDTGGSGDTSTESSGSGGGSGSDSSASGSGGSSAQGSGSGSSSSTEGGSGGGAEGSGSGGGSAFYAGSGGNGTGSGPMGSHGSGPAFSWPTFGFGALAFSLTLGGGFAMWGGQCMAFCYAMWQFMAAWVFMLWLLLYMMLVYALVAYLGLIGGLSAAAVGLLLVYMHQQGMLFPAAAAGAPPKGP